MKIPHSNIPTAIEQLLWITDPTRYLTTRAKQHGAIFAAMSDRMRVVFVSDPTALKTVFSTERIFTISGEANKVLLPLIGPDSILMLGNKRHRKRRQLLMPAFHQENLQAFSQTIQQAAYEIFATTNGGNSISMRSLMQEISLQIIEEVVFGLDRVAAAGQLQTEIAALAELVSSPLVGLTLFLPFLQSNIRFGPYNNLRQQLARTDELIFHLIDSRRKQNGDSHRDILSLLMAAKDEEGESLTDQELRDELTTLLLAGHETTATAMSWAVYQICSHPEVKEKLLSELDSLPQNPDAMQIFRLPYLTAVCNESLRINTVVINTAPRVTKEQVNLNGFEIPTGTYVVGCIYLLHQREDLYPEPHIFLPERFLERNFTPFEFMPFGGGGRRCLGEALANFEMRLVLANLFLNFDVRLVSSEAEKPRRRVVTLAPAKGVRVNLQRRT